VAEWETLLNDHGFLVLTDEVASRMASHLANAMDAQAHPFRRPRGRADKRANQTGAKGVIKSNPTTADTNAGVKQQITLIDWQSESGYPEPITVEMNRLIGAGGSFPAAKDASGVKLAYRANAQVFYGTPGAMQNPFFIDINRGQKFSVTASYLAMTAQMTATPTGLTQVTYAGGSMAVVGNLGTGYTLTLAPVLFTQFFDEISGGGSSQLTPIPEKANFLLPVRSSEFGVSLQIFFFDAAGVRVDSLPIFSVGAMTSPLEIPQDAYSVQVVNQGPGLASFRLVYQISV
jgi:hypothetical protein